MSPDASERAVETVVDLVDGRDETPNERADRNWTEVLQELRLMQTGTQILAGFLLALAFQPAFADLSTGQRVFYLVLLVLATLSAIAALLVGVVAFVFDVVIGGAAAVIVAVVAIVLVAVLWLVIPLILRAKGADA